MAELERLWVRVLGDVQDLDKKLNTAQRRVLRFGDQMRSVGKGLTLGLSVPLAAAGTVAVTAAADMDRLRRGLLAVAGSTAEAQAQLDRLRRVARAPGLGFREAIQGSIRLQAAFGDMPGRAKLAEDALRAFGNAIATVGGGKAELDRVSLALAQIAARGKVSAEEINQLSEAVPQIRQAMQAAFGTADTEVLQRRGIGAEEFIRGLVDELLKLPQVTGGAANAFENFGDALFRARAAAGEAMLPAVTELTAGLADMLEEVEGLDPRLLRVGIAFGAALAVAGPLTVAIGALTTAVTALAAAGASLTLAFLGPAALVAGLAAVVGLFVKARLEAAAFRGELEQLRQSAAGGIDPTLDRAQLAALARGRREALLMLQRRRDEILAVASARHGRPVTIDNPNLPALLTSDEEQELRDVQRAIAATEASLAALFARFKELGERSNEAADGVSAFLEAMDRTIALTRGALAASMPPDTLASAIERSGFRGLGVPLSPLTTSSFGAAQEMVRRFIDAGISFDRLPAEIQDAIRKAFADRAEVAASFQAATNAAGGGGLGLGDLGAALSGIG
ncbi:MAG TPA: tape measure protein, partial [Longimicrobiales bacterium]